MARLDFVPGNRLTLLRNGAEFFPALEAAIDGAAREVYLQTYIFRADCVGLRIAEALKRAAARGVEVCLLIDGFGSSELPEEFADGLRKAGVRLLYFRPDPSGWQLKRNRLRRMHRKVAVADGRLAFVGGVNIEDDIQPGGPPAPSFDFAVAVEGPLVSAIHHMARRLWGLVAWLHLRRRQALPPLPVSAARAGEHRAALARRVASSQKAVALPPGLAISVVSQRALDKTRTVADRGYYFDYDAMLKRYEKDFQTPTTPAVTLFWALDLELDHILKEGMQNRYQRHMEMAKFTREWTAKYFKVYAEPGYESVTLTTAANTRNIVVKDLNGELGKRGPVHGARRQLEPVERLDLGA